MEGGGPALALPLHSKVSRKAPGRIEQQADGVCDDQRCVLALVLRDDPPASNVVDRIGVQGHIQANHEEDDVKLQRNRHSVSKINNLGLPDVLHFPDWLL